jgi:RNA polymerase sigma factor (sigma-70 family)
VSNDPNSLALSAMPFIDKMARTLPEYGREDATQEGFLAALARAKQWSPDKGYVFLSQGNKKFIYRAMLAESARIAPESHKLFRAGLESVSLDDEEMETERDESLQDPNIDLERQAAADELVDAIRNLPEDGRSIMSHVLAGYTVSEFARKFDLSQSSADRLYQRSLEALKATLAG